jgi:hypothetical protein
LLLLILRLLLQSLLHSLSAPDVLQVNVEQVLQAWPLHLHNHTLPSLQARQVHLHNHHANATERQ